MKKSFIVLALLSMQIWGLVSCSKDTSPTPQITLGEELQQALDDGLASFKGKGVSATVIMPDGETWTGASGISYGTKPVTTDMQFGAGSIAKTFTAVTILQLVEENGITLDEPISRWISSYPHIDGSITIRQLLNHTGGLYDFVKNDDYWVNIFDEPSRVWTPEEIILEFNREPVYPKGTDWHYSNTGYNLLRMIIGELEGSGIPAVNEERFFQPLGLSNTFTTMGATLPPGVAHGWWDLNEDGNYDDFYSWQRTAFATGIGGEVFTTSEELAKWIKALFHDGIVLNAQSLDQMLTFHSPCTGEEYLSAGYGLGVVLFNPQQFNDIRLYGHSGNAPGYAAMAAYLPDYGVSIGLMDNTEEGEAMFMSISNILDVVVSHLETTQ